MATDEDECDVPPPRDALQWRLFSATRSIWRFDARTCPRPAPPPVPQAPPPVGPATFADLKRFLSAHGLYVRFANCRARPRCVARAECRNAHSLSECLAPFDDALLCAFYATLCGAPLRAAPRDTFCCRETPACAANADAAARRATGAALADAQTLYYSLRLHERASGALVLPPRCMVRCRACGRARESPLYLDA